MTDNEVLDGLLCRMKFGEEKAFEELYGMTSRKVFAYLLSIVGNYHSAQDLTQDTFIKVRQNVDKYQSGNAFAWIMQIAKNIAYNEINKRKRVIPTDFGERDKTGSYRIDESNVPVLELIGTRLEETDRKIVLMHLSGGFKHREIASDLGIPLGTVLWRYNKAIKTLQKIIKEEYGL